MPTTRSGKRTSVSVNNTDEVVEGGAGSLLDPLPPLYHIFFCTVEPFLTILGVIYAVCRPEVYYQNLIPSSSTVKEKLENLVPVGGAGVMAVRQLGSCFFLLALFASIFLRRTYALLSPGHQELLEPIVYNYLLCLAIADWTHILFTLHDLGPLAFQPLAWNQLVCGNVIITVVLFIVRALWFAGVGRGLKVKSE